MKKIILILCLCLWSLWSSGAWGANCGGETPCACGDTVTSSYSLSSDLTCTNTGDALIINGSGIILDLANYSITGNGSTTVRGIYNASSNTLTIKNGSITNFTSSAIELNGGASPILQDLTISTTGNGGAHAQVRLANVSSPTLTNLLISNSNATALTRGVSFTSTTGTATLYNISSTYNTGYGLSIGGVSGIFDFDTVNCSYNTQNGLYSSTTTASLIGTNLTMNHNALQGVHLNADSLGVGSSLQGDFSYNASRGIESVSTSPLRIHHSTVTYNSGDTLGSGILITNGINVIIENNIVTHNALDGIDFAGTGTGSGICRFNYIAYNGNVNESSAGDGISLIENFALTAYGNVSVYNLNSGLASTGGSAYIYNNTFAHNGQVGFGTRGGFWKTTTSGSGNVVSKNNIIAENYPYDLRASVGGLAVLALDNNNYYNASNPNLVSLDNGATAHTWDWYHASYELSSVYGDPLFTDAANGYFTLLPGSPGINAGVEILGINDTGTSDAAGNIRPANHFPPGKVDTGPYQSPEVVASSVVPQ